MTNYDSEDKVLLPRKLTAENGAKSLLIGEFYVEGKSPCPDCFESLIDGDFCDTCENTGEINTKTAVSWTTIKAIYDKIVGHFCDEN